MEAINRVMISGHLTRDPEHKVVGDNSICKFQIASERPFVNKKTGLATKETCFVDVEMWGPQTASVSKSIYKDDYVLVEGRLKLNSWEESPGKKRYKHLIIGERLLSIDSPKENGSPIRMETSEQSHAHNDGEVMAKVPTQLPF